jgi:hypothetical protein
MVETYHLIRNLRVPSGKSLAKTAATAPRAEFGRGGNGMGPMGASDLSAALWQERRQLELLLFRLETQRLHVEAGNLQWLSFMAAEIETVLDRLRFEALARSVESAAVATEWGLPAQTTLIELIAAAPAGAWPGILGEHLDVLQGLLAQLAEAARVNEETLRTFQLDERPRPSGTAGLVDQLTTAGNLERAIAVVRRTSQPMLAQYLGGDQFSGGDQYPGGDQG